MTAAPARLTLVVGDEEFLVERAVATVAAAVRALEPDADITDAPAASMTVGDLAGLLSPALFGGRRCLILRDAQEAGKEFAAALPGLLADNDGADNDDAVLVVTHAGGTRGRALLDGLSEMASVVVRCGKLTTTRERAEFLAAEVNAAGRRIDAAAVDTLLTTVGTDLRELANACAQLLADTPGPITKSAVSRYSRGRADATGFAVADRAVEGDLGGALEVLRWASALGVAPVLVTSSLAANLRLIARVAGEGRGQPARVAKALGQPVWKVEKALRWSRGWTPAGLSIALRAVASADGDVKGAAVDADYAVERAVMIVTGARQSR